MFLNVLAAAGEVLTKTGQTKPFIYNFFKQSKK